MVVEGQGQSQTHLILTSRPGGILFKETVVLLAALWALRYMMNGGGKIKQNARRFPPRFVDAGIYNCTKDNDYPCFEGKWNVRVAPR